MKRTKDWKPRRRPFEELAGLEAQLAVESNTVKRSLRPLFTPAATQDAVR